ncbi:uncharacterized protein LOC126323788 [Schistocerca gregaria]|uniref:uncharacterized protein LOC126323788 n=1 Tax=Schistocerca gregaria TaxID=7010 RepID=UPI00211E91D8|nr:uncharacterized protein LOC126323788 [Schistocerca gregaria]
MIRDPEFWITEKNIPLMSLNRDFCNEHNSDAVSGRVVELSKSFRVPLEIKPIAWPDEQTLPSRIVEKDVERTFTSDRFRSRMSRLLTLLENQFKDYHQGLSFLVSFLMLFEEEDDVIFSIAKRLNEDEEFIPGYWKHEAVAFATDAYVLDYLLSRHNADVYEHLRSNSILPATYPQKWFVALCVHVLPFDALYLFLKQFFSRGVYFLFQFGLAFFDVLGPSILSSANPADIFAYLRLDSSSIDIEESIPMKIVQRAEHLVVDEIKSLSDLRDLRQKMYDEHLGKKYELFNQTRAEEDEEDEEEEDEEARPGDECQVCQNMVPDYWCIQCDKFICGMCVDKQAGEHKKDTHKLVKSSNGPIFQTPKQLSADLQNLKV